MLVDVKVKTDMQIDIEPEEAFRVLCETLNMKFVLDDYNDFIIKKDPYGDNRVYQRYFDGAYETRPYDDRGDLFIALRNVAVQMFPNLHFRNEKYIYKYEESEGEQ